MAASDEAFRVLLVALGGAAGSVARYGVATWASRCISADFPVGTVVVNLAGSLAFGVIWSVLGKEAGPGKLLLLAGFFGAFTTFSTFVFESAQLLQNGRPLVALLNLLGQNLLGLLFVSCGLMIGGLLAPDVKVGD